MDHTKTHRLATSIAAAQWAAADRQRRARAAREAADEDATGQVPARASLRSRLRDLLRPATRRTV
jgi:hypothetical protein